MDKSAWCLFTTAKFISPLATSYPAIVNHFDRARKASIILLAS